ncbi:MAG: hypothetical protein ACYDAO_04220 [Thermoplasmataceae archaeon]
MSFIPFSSLSIPQRYERIGKVVSMLKAEQNDTDTHYIKNVIEILQSYFAYETYCRDTILPHEIRALFYDLEDMGIISTQNTSIELNSNKDWRIIEWIYNIPYLDHVYSEYPKKVDKKVELVVESTLYDEIYAEAWEQYENISIEDPIKQGQ